MRVLRLISSTDPTHGGPIQGLLTTATAMAADGHVTEVVTLDDPDAGFVKTFPFKVHATGGVGRYGLAPRFSRWVAENAANYDVAVVHGLWNPATISGWAGLRKAGLPYVVYTHGMMDPWFRSAYPVKHWAKQFYWWAFQGRVLRDARTVLFTSEEERRLARGVFIGPAYQERVVAYGANQPPEGPSLEAAFRTKLPALGQRKYLLYLSRIHPKKGCDLLIEAFAQVAARFPHIDLVLAGPDHVGLTEQLKQLAARAGIGNRIHWPGMVQGEAKWGAYQGAAAFILPSHQENFGIVVAEAMACGTPVLISNQVNIWREVEAAGAGFVADDTAEGTLSLLERFLPLSIAEREQLGIAARRAYERHFSAEGAARDLTVVLQGLIKETSLGH